MSEKQEMIADIITEMRDIGKLDEKSNDMITRSLMGLGLRTLADRIEAAWKREKAEIEASALSVGGIVEASRQTGNAAAMRKALEFIKLASDDYEKYGTTKAGALDVIYEKACAALAAPPRNCEKYETADEAMDDFADEALIEEWNVLKAGKDRDMLAKELYYFINWLFATATEQKGESNGK